MRKPVHLPKKIHTAFALTEEDSRLFRETVGVVNPVASDRVLLEKKDLNAADIAMAQTGRMSPRSRFHCWRWAMSRAL